MKYRVIASIDSFHHIDVEAPDATTARELAEKTDLNQWSYEALIGSGWTIWNVEPVNDSGIV